MDLDSLGVDLGALEMDLGALGVDLDAMGMDLDALVARGGRSGAAVILKPVESLESYSIIVNSVTLDSRATL